MRNGNPTKTVIESVEITQSSDETGERERFEAFASKIVRVPKSEIDAQRDAEVSSR